MDKILVFLNPYALSGSVKQHGGFIYFRLNGTWPKDEFVQPHALVKIHTYDIRDAMLLKKPDVVKLHLKENLELATA